MNTLTRLVLACAVALSTSLIAGCGGEEPAAKPAAKTDAGTPAKDKDKPADKPATP